MYTYRAFRATTLNYTHTETTHKTMSHLLLTGNPLKGETSFQTATSKVINDMPFPSDQDVKDVKSHHSPGRRTPNSRPHLRPPENRAPNSRYPFSTPCVRDYMADRRRESRMLDPVRVALLRPTRLLRWGEFHAKLALAFLLFDIISSRNHVTALKSSLPPHGPCSRIARDVR